MKTKSFLQQLLPRAFARYLALPLFGSLLEEFSQWMRQRGYPNTTIKNWVECAPTIARWLGRRGKRTLADLTDQDMAAVHNHFLSNSNVGGPTRALKVFLHEKEKISIGHAPKPSFVEREQLAFGTYLQNVHGFAAATVDHHQRQIRFFLKFIKADRRPSAVCGVRLDQIEAYIRHSATTNNRYSLKMVVGNVRTYLRWKHAQGCLRESLHEQIDAPRCYRLERLPRAWPWEQIVALLRSIDRKEPGGHRDFTMLFLAARYGLRSSEVVRLRLDDIDWRAGTLRISQTKTKQALLLPLIDEAGDVLADYLRKARQPSPCRELFLRLRAPMGPIKPASMGGILEARIQRSGLPIKSTGTHGLRHSFAVHLLRQGVSTKSIGDALGHRRVESTAVYLRLAVEDLREVALPLPQNGRASELAFVDWRERVPRALFSKAKARPCRMTQFQSPFASFLDRYLAVRRALGRAFFNEERILRHWDDFLFRYHIGVAGFGARALQVWAGETSYLNANIRRNRLRVVRNFLLYYRRNHPRTWVPDSMSFPRSVPYRLPRLVSTAEMARVLATARRLPPVPSNPLRAETVHLALALLFCCGLRRGELLRLRLKHYDEHDRTLRIEATKFHKSRLVPLHSSIARLWKHFLIQRGRRKLPVDLESPLIWSGRPEATLTGMSASGLKQNWQHLCVSCGVLDARGRPPTLHHLRHSMAVTALQRWYTAGINPQSKLPHLATYLGHVSPVSTHHYLHLTPGIRQAASRRFHQSCSGLFGTGGVK